MKRFLPLILCFSLYLAKAQTSNLWKIANSSSHINAFEGKTPPADFKVYKTNFNQLKNNLNTAPMRGDQGSPELIITLPNADGYLEQYSVIEAPVLHPALEAKYPGIKSYAGQGIDDPSSVIRFSISDQRGFHAMTLSGTKGTFYIDPVPSDKNTYVVYARKNLIKKTNFECNTEGAEMLDIPQFDELAALNATDDSKLRKYRLALSCTAEYGNIFAGNGSDAEKTANILAQMNISMTRVNGIYERDLAITMELIPNNDELIFFGSTSADPWGSEWNSTTQTFIDNTIGDANYDIGHNFNTTGGGNAGCIGCVCVTGSKGSAYTGRADPTGDPFDIDYVAHEIGHQFGGYHTMNTCSRSGSGATEVEPASASTIMGYAGICSSNIQNNSDAYFAYVNIRDISQNIQSGASSSCPVVIDLSNNAPTANAGDDYTIPVLTPFVLRGSGSDADGDILTYTWEQNDPERAPGNGTPSSTWTVGPLFRSFEGTTSPDRYMPKLGTVVSGDLSSDWEVLPSVSRNMEFSLVVKDHAAGGGQTADDRMNVTVSANAGPFVINEPVASTIWREADQHTVSWDVAGTDAAPINCANVNILLSYDGGFTYPEVLASNTPNDGSEEIIVPVGLLSTNCRVVVEAADNIFYAMSAGDFIIDEGGILASASLMSDNLNPKVANPGDKVTLTFETNQPIITPTVSIIGHNIEPTSEGNIWTAEYTLTESDPEGQISILIDNIESLEGKTYDPVSYTTDDTFVVFEPEITYPSLSTVEFISNNSRKYLCKVGDEIYLKFTSSEEIFTPMVTIGGKEVSVEASGNNWVATYVMEENDSEGSLSFSITNLKDLSGYEGDDVTATTDGSAITFDKTAPVISDVSLISSNEDPTLAIVGDLITLSFIVSEDIKNPGIKIGERSVAPSRNGANWSAQITLTDSDIDGDLALLIEFLSDFAGNSVDDIVATTDESEVFFDNTAPSLTSVTIKSENQNSGIASVGDIINLAFISSETINTPTVTISDSEVDVTLVEGSWVATYTILDSDQEGNLSFSINNIKDIPGLIGEEVTITTDNSFVEVDKTAPVLNEVSISSDNITPSLAKPGDKISIKIRANESLLAPSVLILGKEATIQDFESYLMAEYVLTADDTDGDISFEISNIQDIAGNTSENNISVTTDASSVTFDKTLPSFDLVNIVSNNDNAITHAVAGDEITLIFKSTESISTPIVKIANKSVTPSFEEGQWKATYTLLNSDVEGVIVYSIKSYRDAAGNRGEEVISSTDASSVTFDKTNPTLTTVTMKSSDEGSQFVNVGSSITINFTADEVIDNVDVTILGNTVTASNDSENNWSASYTLTSNDPINETFTFTINYTDMAGNEGSSTTETTDRSSLITGLFDSESLVLNIFPNPTHNELNILKPENINVGNISIFDLSGKRMVIPVIGKTSGTQIKLDVSTLKAGAYIIRLTDNKSIYSSRFVKE